MDNLTHSLIGVAVARTALAWRRGREPQAPTRGEAPLLDRLAVLTSVVASNLPDADGALPAFLPHLDPRLLYLTHHRGLTHTLLLLLPLAAISLGLTRMMTLKRDRNGVELRRSWRFLSGVALLALAGHVGADAWNDYGVHPFSPAWDRWFYGGFIFIVEPLLWLALLAWLVWAGRTRGGRITGWVIVAAAGLLLWTNPMTSQALWPVALGATVWGLAHLAAQWKLKSLKVAWAGVFGVLLAFFLGREAVRAKFTRSEWSDLSTTPAPANPFCWKVIAVDAGGETYRARVGVVSLWPEVFKASDCYRRGMEPALAPLRPVAPAVAGAEREGAAFYWKGEFVAPWKELTTLAETDCRADRLMGFVRVPYWFRTSEGRTLVGDLRYDQRGGGFTEMEFDGKAFGDCPAWAYPHWDWPVSRNARRS